MRREFFASPGILISRWKAICPSRDSSQLTYTLAAVGWGARFIIASWPIARDWLAPSW
jgi:hypothetical protein